MLRCRTHTRLALFQGAVSFSLTLLLNLTCRPEVQAASLDSYRGTTPAASQLTALRAVQPVVPEVDRLDRAAYEALAALAAVARSKATEKVDAALVAYVTAEAALNTARDEAWAAIPATQAGAVVVNEPLILAMLDLHIEVRRQLGPNSHTVVPGLTEDQGCAGDVVGERLIYAYGAAAASPLGATSGATLDALDKIARQVACLGAKQLSRFEAAAAGGFEAVAERMKTHGLGRLVPAFARLAAPVQVLILDARKHRGESSQAWRWFAKYGEGIREGVESAGWASGELLVWDRRQGLLVGFPRCTPGQLNPDCVDLRAFVESIQDPQALGLGDCAFAGMLSLGTNLLGGEERYICPTRTCEEPQSTTSCSSPGSPVAVASGNCGTSGLTVSVEGSARLPESERSQLQSTWSQLSEGELDQMGSFCRGGQMDLQGVNFSLDDCFEELTSGNTNPFDTYAACRVEAVGGGDPPQIGSQLQGVPMGANCRIADGDGNKEEPQEEPKEEPKKEEPPKEEPKKEAPQEEPKKEPDFWDKAAAVAKTVLLAIVDAIVEAFAPDGYGELLSEEGAGAELGLAQALTEKKLKDAAFRDNTISHKDYADWHGKPPAEIADFLKKRGAWDCVDGLDCNNSCTGLGQQISAANACTEDLLGAFTQALGLPDKKDLIRKIDIVSYPNPQDGNGSTDPGVGACLGNTDPARQSASCGLVLCANNLLATGIGASCGCDQASPGVILQTDLCLMVRCADGNTPGPDCNCQPVEPSDPQPGPGPLPDAAKSRIPR